MYTLAVTNNSLIVLSKRETMPGVRNPAIYSVPRKVTIIGGKSTTTNLLGLNNRSQQSINICAYTHREVWSLLLIKEIFLSSRWRPLENKNQSKCGVVALSPNGILLQNTLHLRLRELCGRGDKKIVRARGSESSL